MSQPWKQSSEVTTLREEDSLVKMKSSSVLSRKQNDYVGSYISPTRPEGIKRVYGLNIEGWARDLTSHNLILLIMSYPINSARESMYTRDEFSARAIYMRI